MTNIFIFESPSTKPKEKKWGYMAYYVTSPGKVGETRPPPNCAQAYIYSSKHIFGLCIILSYIK